MTMDPYSAAVREMFAATTHAGDLDSADVVESDEQGVRLRLAATQSDGRIELLRFRARACPHVIAACENFCRDFEGQPVTALSGFRATDIMSKLGIPVEKTGRILVLEDAVQSLGRRICERSATA